MDQMEEDPAAAFLQREHEDLGDIGDEILGNPTTQSEVSAFAAVRKLFLVTLFVVFFETGS